MDELTDRQLQVMEMLANGITPKQIALELKISQATVFSHLARARQKLDANTQEEAVAKAAVLGLVTVRFAFRQNTVAMVSE